MDFMMKKRAVVLLSGGLDSATALAIAQSEGYECYGLGFNYGQRHLCELECARKVAKAAGIKYFVMDINLKEWGGSALTDDSIAVPDSEQAREKSVPVTYVPARNLIFLSFATAWAEVLKAKDIFIGVNNVDYSGYPDCRPEFINAFEEAARLGTCACDEGWRFEIHTPLQKWSKGEIITKGTVLEVDYSLTTSCYNPDNLGRACGKCDSCSLRRVGFAEAKVKDPTVYQ